MTAEEVQKFPYYAKWLASNTPSIKADKTHRLSGYAIFSYSYGSLFSLSANTRFDASNKFGSRSNEKFLPVWSASGMLNLKELALRPYDVVSDFPFPHPLSVRRATWSTTKRRISSSAKRA